MTTPKGIILMTSSIEFGSKQKIKASAPTAKELELLREQWRPKVGPAANINATDPDDTKVKTEFNSVAGDQIDSARLKAELRELRLNWRPKVGPLSAA